jgi:hypothetical protein
VLENDYLGVLGFRLNNEGVTAQRTGAARLTRYNLFAKRQAIRQLADRSHPTVYTHLLLILVFYVKFKSKWFS